MKGTVTIGWAGLVLVLLATAGAAEGQGTIVPRRCESPRVPVGSMRGSGEVAYRLKSDGRPDTATVVVLAVRDLSVPAFRHAAVRILERCRYDNRTLPDPRPDRLAQTVFFDSAGPHLTFASAAAADTLRAMELVQPAQVPELVEESDRILEERPRMLECKSPPRSSQAPPPGYTPGSESAAPPETFDRFRMTMIVDREGRVQRGSVKPVESTQPGGTNSSVRFVEGCRFTPGRVAGVPVAVSMTYTMNVRTTVEVIRTVRRVQ